MCLKKVFREVASEHPLQIFLLSSFPRLKAVVFGSVFKNSALPCRYMELITNQAFLLLPHFSSIAPFFFLYLPLSFSAVNTGFRVLRN